MTEPEAAPSKADHGHVDESTLLVRRRCPSCGAPVEHSDTATAVACDYCRVRLAITTAAAVPRYAVPARLDSDAALAEAKRALRGAKIRVRHLDSPRLLYFPFARWRAYVHALWLHPVARSPEPEHRSSWTASAAPIDLGLGFALPSARALARLRAEARRPLATRGLAELEATTRDFQYRIGSWEQTVSAQPDLSFVDQSLGIRTQTLSVVPLDELLDPSVEERSVPGRVAPAVTKEEAQSRLERQLAEAHREEPGDRELARYFTPAAKLQWIYFPYVAIDFEGPEADGTVFLDGVTLKHRSMVDRRAMQTLSWEARFGEAAGWRFTQPETRFTALICPNCSMPLRFHASACLHPCENCRRMWEVGAGRLRERRAKLLRPRGGTSGAVTIGERRALPFYVVAWGVGESTRRVFVPAAECRHPRALWNLASSLTRRNDPWEAAECDLRVDLPVTLRSEDAGALAPFGWALAHQLDSLSMGTCSTPEPELIWLEMTERGGALIEPNSGLSVPSSALVPWPTH